MVNKNIERHPQSVSHKRKLRLRGKMLLSVAMTSAMAKSNLGEEWVYFSLLYSSRDMVHQ